jgi:hypothetical protein
MMVVATVHRLEQLFRRGASLDFDKSDIRRLEQFIHRTMRQLLIRAEANARANGRDVVQPWDLPLSSGLQSTIHRFRILNAELQLSDHLRQLVGLPAIDLAYGAETEARLPEIAGGLCLALGQCFRILDEEIENPQSDHWDRADRLFELLL